MKGGAVPAEVEILDTVVPPDPTPLTFLLLRGVLTGNFSHRDDES